MAYAYGVIPSPQDRRDYTRLAVGAPVALAPSATLAVNGWLPPVRDQGAESSCTGYAIAYGRALMRYRHTGQYTEYSPHYLYWQERKREGTTNQDTGAYPRDAMKVLRKLGIATEAQMPYWRGNYEDPATDADNANAFPYRVTRYLRCHDLSAIKTEIAMGNPVLIGLYVTESFERTNGLIDVPSPWEQILGGHAICPTSYTDNADYPGGGYVTFINSWGSGWSLGGYASLSYSFFQSSYFMESWSYE